MWAPFGCHTAYDQFPELKRACSQPLKAPIEAQRSGELPRTSQPARSSGSSVCADDDCSNQFKHFVCWPSSLTNLPVLPVCSLCNSRKLKRAPSMPNQPGSKWDESLSTQVNYEPTCVILFISLLVRRPPITSGRHQRDTRQRATFKLVGMLRQAGILSPFASSISIQPEQESDE